MASMKAPPPMRDGLPYEDWVKELEIWSVFAESTIPKPKQGAAVFLTLAGKAREAVLAQVGVSGVNADDGLDKVIACLDKLYLKDKTESGFAAFDRFIKFRRPFNMSIKDYAIEFNLRYNRLKDYDMTLPEGVLAYTFLTCANLQDDQERLCRATVAKLTYADMKQQIEKISVTKEKSDDDDVEPQFMAAGTARQTRDEWNYDYYEDGYSGQFRRKHDDDPTQPLEADKTQQAGYEEEYDECDDTYWAQSRSRFRPQNSQGASSKLNPLDEFGNPTPCRFCHSVYHWVEKCPDAPPELKSRPVRSRGSYNRGYGRPGRGGPYHPGRGYGGGRGRRGGPNKQF